VRIVLLVVEVPTGDVVDVAVAVVVDPVRALDDQILGSRIPLPLWSGVPG